jgi:5'-methylthioadenosine phosphorylase
MRVWIDHVGIAVDDVAASLAFFRDVLGLDVTAPEDVAAQRVRVRFLHMGPSSLELLEATAPDSPIARFLARRGPGLHHVALGVEDIDAAIARLQARGVRMIDTVARPGAEGALVAFIHPSAANGVLVELKQARAGDEARLGGEGMSVAIGIIGGSGLYDMTELAGREERHVQTPFGEPSGPYVIGTLRGRRVAFLSRHGGGHRLTPSEINFRANIFGFKVLGVDFILSASAVGSLQEQYRPLDLVFPDQFIDRTRGRISTFFGGGIVGHVGFAHPICAELSALAAGRAEAAGARVHRGGTYVCMEGPQFSTLAESRLYRSWGADVIGMTNLQEAKLAREAEIAYATMALVTDYDCWHPEHDAVTVEMIVANLTENAKMAQQVIAGVVERLDVTVRCSCHSALATGIITDRNLMPEQTKRALAPIIGKYVK